MKLRFYTLFLLSFFALKLAAEEQKPLFEAFWAVSVPEIATLNDIFNEEVNVINWLCGGGCMASMSLSGDKVDFWLKGKAYVVASELSILDGLNSFIRELKAYGYYKDPVFVFREKTVGFDKKLWIEGVLLTDPKLLKALKLTPYKKLDSKVYFASRDFASLAYSLQRLKRDSIRKSE